MPKLCFSCYLRFISRGFNRPTSDRMNATIGLILCNRLFSCQSEAGINDLTIPSLSLAAVSALKVVIVRLPTWFSFFQRLELHPSPPSCFSL